MSVFARGLGSGWAGVGCANGVVCRGVGVQMVSANVVGVQMVCANGVGVQIVWCASGVVCK